jgi:hypothetical protein
MIKAYFEECEQQQQQLFFSLAEPFHTQQHDLEALLCFQS